MPYFTVSMVDFVSGHEMQIALVQGLKANTTKLRDIRKAGEGMPEQIMAMQSARLAPVRSTVS
jgi:hypothetical protein